MASRAFDDRRPPSLDVIDDCVHCGFCLPTCPTYDLWGEEMDSPRGRIVLMKAGLEEGSTLSSEMVTHFDRCLGCMACVTACPSGVRYDQLIEDTRAQVERRHPRPAGERLWRAALFALFPHPGRLRALAPGLPVAHALRRLLDRRPLRGPLPRLAALVRLAPEVPAGVARHRLPRVTAARGTVRRGRVALLQGCVQRAFFGPVNEATAQVLAAEGWEVHAPRAPRCCGALQLHSGDEGARDLARRTIAALEGFDTVVATAAGCGSAMRDYGHALRDDPAWAERARAFTGRVRDATELLAEHEPLAPRHPVPRRVAYHDACHLAHAQGVREQPRALLRGIPGLELVEPEGWELCCGSAGLYNVLEPQAAAELGRRKVERLRATGAEVIAAANPGCALQIAAHARDDGGPPLRVVHPLELLHASLQGHGAP